MALTRDHSITVKERAARDPAFRRALRREAADCMERGEEGVGRAMLRDYLEHAAEADRS